MTGRGTLSHPTVEVLGTARQARAARALFADGFDTAEIAALFQTRETEIVWLLAGTVSAAAARPGKGGRG